MSKEITNVGGFFKIKDLVNGKIKGIAKDDVRFELLNGELSILKGATYPIAIITDVSQVSVPSEANLTDLLNTLSSLT